MNHSSIVQPTKNQMDICARGFWSTGQDAFFDVRLFYPNASINHSMTITAAYRKHESTKKSEYAQRVREVEHGVFTPLVLSATGGMGREAVTFEIGRWNFQEGAKTIFGCHGVDSLSSLFCNPPFCHPMHPWKQVHSPSPS